MPRNWIIALAALLILLFGLGFDLVEIVIGEAMLRTNSLRPRVGRLWEAESQENEGLEIVSELPGPVSEPVPSPGDLDELLDLLALHPEIKLDRAAFLRFYNLLPPERAKSIIDPLRLYDLWRLEQWHSVLFRRSGDQLSLHFTDYNSNLLLDTFTDLTLWQRDSRPVPERDGRTVAAEIFYRAFDRLSRSFRLQIISDPLKLIQWGEGLVQVAISPFVENGSVVLIFEINTDYGERRVEMRASEMAVNYLIREINRTGMNPPIQAPSQRGERQ